MNQELFEQRLTELQKQEQITLLQLEEIRVLQQAYSNSIEQAKKAAADATGAEVVEEKK
jgi:hypothetical protein